MVLHAHAGPMIKNKREGSRQGMIREPVPSKTRYVTGGYTNYLRSKARRKGPRGASVGGFCTGSRRAEEKGQRLLLAGLDGIRKAGIVTDGPGVR